jgi:hypothetical protein
MKNAVYYRDSWLMPTSHAKLLYDLWKKSGDNKDRKKLDDHCKQVDKNYKELSGVSV